MILLNLSVWLIIGSFVDLDCGKKWVPDFCEVDIFDFAMVFSVVQIALLCGRGMFWYLFRIELETNQNQRPDLPSRDSGQNKHFQAMCFARQVIWYFLCVTVLVLLSDATSSVYFETSVFSVWSLTLVLGVVSTTLIVGGLPRVKLSYPYRAEGLESTVRCRMIRIVPRTKLIRSNKVIFYAFFLMLLLLIANDVERNPGPCAPSNIGLLSCNLRSIRGLTQRTKLHSLLKDHEYPMVILIQETWLNDDVFDAELRLPEYAIYRQDRLGGKNGGGVAICVHNSLTSRKAGSFCSSNLESVWVTVSVRLTSGLQSYTFCSLYRPNAACRSDEDLHSCLRKITRPRGKHSIAIIGGDLNTPDLKWNALLQKFETTSTNSQALVATLDAFGFHQHIRVPTREENTLDVLASNQEAAVFSVNVVDGIADHCAIVARLADSVTPVDPKREPTKDWAKCDFSKVKKEICKSTAAILEDDQPESAWGQLRDCLISATDAHVPTRCSRKHGAHDIPFSRNLIKLVRRKRRLYGKWRGSMNPADKIEYQRFRNMVAHECRKAKQAYLDKVSNSLSDNPKRFWSYVRNSKTGRSTIPSLNSPTNHSQSATEKACILNNHFKSVYTEEPSSVPQTRRVTSKTMNAIVIEQKGVRKLLRGIDPSKSPGPDGIHPRILKACAEEISSPLAHIFRISLAQGVVPHDWRMATVVPVFKKGDKCDPSNYRPISLTSVCSKIMEHIVVSNLHQHFEEERILSVHQHGFRKKHNTETQLLSICQDWHTALLRRVPIDAIFLDFSKAFDRVPHMRLLEKLNQQGVDQQTLTWVEKFLADRTQRTRVDGSLSDEIRVTSGVPQGTVLGPTLFCAYINDIAAHVSKDTRVKMYADDTLVYRSIHNEDDAKELQDDVDHIQAWANKFLMKFNVEKCVHMRVACQKRLRNPSYRYYLDLGGSVIPNCSEARYLGVLLTSDFHFSKHIDGVCVKANQVIGFLRRNFGGASRTAKKTAFTSLVRSRLEYASSVIDPYFRTDCKKLEAVQRRGARFIHNSHWNRESVSEMLQQQNLPTLAFRRTMQRHTMLDRILNGDVDVQHFCCADISFKTLRAPAPTQCRKDFLTRTLAERPLACAPNDQTAVFAQTCYCYNSPIANARSLWGAESIMFAP